MIKILNSSGISTKMEEIKKWGGGVGGRCGEVEIKNWSEFINMDYLYWDEGFRL